MGMPIGMQIETELTLAIGIDAALGVDVVVIPWIPWRGGHQQS